MKIDELTMEDLIKQTHLQICDNEAWAIYFTPFAHLTEEEQECVSVVAGLDIITVMATLLLTQLFIHIDEELDVTNRLFQSKLRESIMILRRERNLET